MLHAHARISVMELAGEWQHCVGVQAILLDSSGITHSCIPRLVVNCFIQVLDEDVAHSGTAKRGITL